MRGGHQNPADYILKTGFALQHIGGLETALTSKCSHPMQRDLPSEWPMGGGAGWGPFRILLAQEPEPIALGSSDPQPSGLSTREGAVHSHVLPPRQFNATMHGYNLVRYRRDQSSVFLAQTATVDRMKDCFTHALSVFCAFSSSQRNLPWLMSLKNGHPQIVKKGFTLTAITFSPTTWLLSRVRQY